ncbi:catalase-related domain-containing protein [Ruixingdingia sedimenti]|uniref:catalase n=1 Tax=Ruixingdingia sedimenti TaxID=3073604 RepID=A0ABU1FCY1_9RHOB|nr:catalase-related domain-containing protein [Xinfangfangia sp. LG-4]MDR5654704.1 catalase-related domain-containing protein [Xinfangfangia sp. LG-4]
MNPSRDLCNRAGFRSHAAEISGEKRRLRAESFADHYSQARLFYRSQAPVEQKHIAGALVFELSKCEVPVIRERMVAHLMNIDGPLAETVAGKLGIRTMPEPAEAAMPARDLPDSPALSMLANPPGTFAGRKLGVLVSDGVDAGLLHALQAAMEAEGATLDIVAPKVGGVTAADGGHIAAMHMIDGGPSVLFDAVALILTPEGADMLAQDVAGRDFVSDAFAHCKFIGHTPGAAALLAAAGVEAGADEGLIALAPGTCADFVAACRKLRLWSRERAVKP